MSNAEVSTAEHPLQQQVNELYMPWSKEFGANGKSFKALPYEPGKYPGQRVEEFISRARPYEAITPEVFREIQQFTLGHSLGYTALTAYWRGGQFAEAFNPYAEEVHELLKAKKSVGVFTMHCEYKDTILAGGALNLALSKHPGLPAYPLDVYSWTFMNKAMAYTGVMRSNIPRYLLARREPKAIASKLSHATNIVWVSPDTPSADRFNIPEEISNYLNINAMRDFKTATPGHGVLLAAALHGSQTKLRADDDTYVQPEVRPGSFGLMRQVDAVLPVVIVKQGKSRIADWAVGELMPNSKNKKDSLPQVNSINTELAKMLNELTGRDVEYTELVSDGDNIVRRIAQTALKGAIMPIMIQQQKRAT